MKNSKRFDRDLNRGLTFEQGEALMLLHKTFPDYYIKNASIDPIETTGGKIVGPRWYKGPNRESDIIDPDFELMNDAGDMIWIDAKLKGSVYGPTSNPFFTIDGDKHVSYMQFPKKMRDNFFLILKNERTGRIYIAKFNTKPEMIVYNNKYNNYRDVLTPKYYVKDLAHINQ